MKRNRSDRFFRKNTEPSAVFSVGAAVLGRQCGGLFCRGAGMGRADTGALAGAAALVGQRVCPALCRAVPAGAGGLRGAVAAGAGGRRSAAGAGGGICPGLFDYAAGRQPDLGDGWQGVLAGVCAQGAAQLLSLPLLLVLATLCCAAGGKRGAFARLYQKCEKSVRALVAWSVLGCAAQSALALYYLPALW